MAETIDILQSEDIVQVNLTVYSLRSDATFSAPDYNFIASEDLIFSRKAFASYDDLFFKIQQSSSIGYLKTQFFRVCLQSQMKTNEFLEDYDFSQINLSSTVLLGVVKYTKQQVLQYRKVIESREEQLHLERLLNSKKEISQPSRKLPKYIQHATTKIGTDPPTLIDAYARIRRLGRFSEEISWRFAEYLHCGLINAEDIEEMQENDIYDLFPIEESQESDGSAQADLIDMEVPEILVGGIQQLIARRKCQKILSEMAK